MSYHHNDFQQNIVQGTFWPFVDLALYLDILYMLIFSYLTPPRGGRVTAQYFQIDDLEFAS